MHCSYYASELCRSCTRIETPYDEQVARKQARVVQALPELGWLEPFRSQESGFRNKAKMVVGGTAGRPTLGILDGGRQGVDLRGCGLHEASIAAALPVLAAFIGRAGLTPYDVNARRGELKHLLVTTSPVGELMVRFVLRSSEAVPRIRKHLDVLQESLPALVVASINLQPTHAAVLEGPEEIVLTERAALPMPVAGLDLALRPQSFFQTNTTVAAGLYEQVRAWVGEIRPAGLWDLYCGVGGFALACAAPGRDVLGVETSEEAVASARQAAAAAGLAARFEAGDATTYAVTAESTPDLVVVNPPRRGIGPELASWLERSGVPHVVYSSCNPDSLARDLAVMPSLRPQRGRLFDMFPQTDHAEVAVLLERGPQSPG